MFECKGCGGHGSHDRGDAWYVTVVCDDCGVVAFQFALGD
jgi:hypothetical protein